MMYARIFKYTVREGVSLCWGLRVLPKFHRPVHHFLCEIREYAATRPVHLLRDLRIGLAVVVLDWISGLRDSPKIPHLIA